MQKFDRGCCNGSSSALDQIYIYYTNQEGGMRLGIKLGIRLGITISLSARIVGLSKG